MLVGVSGVNGSVLGGNRERDWDNFSLAEKGVWPRWENRNRRIVQKHYGKKSGSTFCESQGSGAKENIVFT